MAKALTHLVEYSRGGWYPDWMKIISYGKCQVSPYVENNLWFVSIPQGIYAEKIAEGKDINDLITNYSTPLDKIYPEQDTIFFGYRKLRSNRRI